VTTTEEFKQQYKAVDHRDAARRRRVVVTRKEQPVLVGTLVYINDQRDLAKVRLAGGSFINVKIDECRIVPE
jgi:hypothetical protein